MFEEYRGFIVWSEDFRSMGYCSKGVRAGFSKYNLSYSEFISNGIDAADLLTAVDGNAMVLTIVEAAHERRRK